MDCLTCEKAGDCLLQEYCYRYGVEHTSFVKGETNSLELDDDNHLIERDQNKCILCGKCVRVCQEVQVTNAVDFAGRGLRVDRDVVVRPPAEHGVLPLLRAVRRPVPDRRAGQQAAQGHPHLGAQQGAHHLPVLRRGLQLRPERRTTARSWASRPTTTRPVNAGSLCVKGRFHTDLINSPDRITTPLIKRDGVFEEASWDEALDLVAAQAPRDQGPRRAPTPSPCSAPRAAPTKRTTSCSGSRERG